MTTEAGALPDPPKVRSLTTSVATLFFVNGMVYSNWLPRIPEVRDKLGLTDAGLGASLLGGGLGGLIGSFVTAKLIDRFGTKRVLTISATLISFGLPLLARVNKPILLLLALSFIGFCDVLNDMSMNAQAVMAQARHSRPILNRMHGAWSLGSVTGAGIGSIAAAVKLSLTAHFTMIGLLLLAIVHVARRKLLTVDDPSRPSDTDIETPARRRISPAIVALGLTAIGVAAVEATPNDWSAVMMKDVLGAGRIAGAGTFAFATAMLIARLSGDYVMERIGSKRMLNGAIALNAIGVLIVVAARSTPLGILGFAVWGTGASVLFPQLYGLAATQKGLSAASGLGAMGVGQRLGFLLCPVLVGAVSEALSLRLAFVGIVGAAIAIILVARQRLAAS